MNKKEPLLILGCGGHANSIIDLVESTNKWEIIGLVGEKNEVGLQIMNYPIIGTDNDLKELRNLASNIFLGIGQIKSPKKRMGLVSKLKALGYKTPTLISKNAYVSKNAKVSEGCSIGHFAIVNAGATIGKFCILNSKCLIEHNSIVGEFSHVSTGALINGDVVIGEQSFIGSGSIIREGLSLPSNIIIGAGQRVMGWPIKI